MPSCVRPPRARARARAAILGCDVFPCVRAPPARGAGAALEPPTNAVARRLAARSRGACGRGGHMQRHGLLRAVPCLECRSPSTRAPVPRMRAGAAAAQVSDNAACAMSDVLSLYMRLAPPLSPSAFGPPACFGRWPPFGRISPPSLEHASLACAALCAINAHPTPNTCAPSAIRHTHRSPPGRLDHSRRPILQPHQRHAHSFVSRACFQPGLPSCAETQRTRHPQGYNYMQNHPAQTGRPAHARKAESTLGAVHAHGHTRRHAGARLIGAPGEIKGGEGGVRARARV